MAALWILLAGMEWSRPCFFLHDDNATWFTGAYVHDFRVLTETGSVAAVNYYQHAGEPFIGQGQTAVLYPLIYPAVALAKWISGDLRWTVEWLALIHLSIGLAGFYFWARQKDVEPLHAALAGLAWVLNPFVLIIAASWITVVYVAAWLPWLFWAADRMWLRPGATSALYLGAIAGLFFLQGYVQWTTYALLFLGIYVLLQFEMRKEAKRLAILYYLVISALIFLTLTLPLLLPMLHAMNISVVRSQPMGIESMLSFSIPAIDFIYAQCLNFRGCAFGVTTVILFSPALIFFPVILARFIYERREIHRQLFPLLLLSGLALLFSTRWHALLSALPVLDRFRWPFKVFVFADFFLLSALVVGISAWATPHRKWNPVVSLILCIVVSAQLVVALPSHDKNTLSKTLLPAGVNPVVAGMDPQLGRVVAFGDDLPESRSYDFLTHAYSTYYAFPSLGGYNPLGSLKQLEYALYLDFPNFCTNTITPNFQKDFQSRAVRYWLVDPHSSHFKEIKALPSLKVLEATADRVVYEDTQAAPLVYPQADPTKACPIRYSGNSMLISLDGAKSPVEISVGPTDGWWYRVDGGNWMKPSYENGRLEANFEPSARVLEVSYFDSRFQMGLAISTLLALLVGFVLFRTRFRPNRTKETH